MKTTARFSEAAPFLNITCKRQVWSPCPMWVLKGHVAMKKRKQLLLLLQDMKKLWITSGNYWKPLQWYTSNMSYEKSITFNCIQHFGGCLFISAAWMTHLYHHMSHDKPSSNKQMGTQVRWANFLCTPWDPWTHPSYCVTHHMLRLSANSTHEGHSCLYLLHLTDPSRSWSVLSTS